VIPSASFLAVLYLLTAVAVLSASRWDAPWIKAARIFLAAVMLSWCGFYLLVIFNPFSFETLRSLSRWLHVPNAVAVLLIVAGRWYAQWDRRDSSE